MTHDKVFYYFENKFRESIAKYGFSYLEIEPCHVNSKDDLILFTERIANTLFKEAEFSFIDNEGVDDVVNFLFNGQQISLKIDPKYEHIEVDFFKKIKLLADLSGKFVTRAQPVPILVSGDIEDMKAAWSEGFPIQLDEIDFFRSNVNGKWFKKEEISSSFILNETIDIDYYGKIILKGLNVYLAEKKKDIRYCDKQIRFYIQRPQRPQFVCMYINGKYAQGFTTINGKTIFKNNFINQIFLLNHWTMDRSVTSLKYASEECNEIEITVPFKTFISNFGRDN